jgi:competence protein ComEA
MILVVVAVMTSAAAIAASAPAATAASSQKIVPIDLNTADAKALAGVPGVGDVLAAEIIKARPFKTVEDLKNIKGIGPGKKFDSLKPYFMVAKPTTTAGGSKLAPGEKININTATAEQLDKLPDVGAVKSKAIIDYRTKNGPFAKIEDVTKVKGIGAATFAKIKDLIVVK